jgi:hypothetical protein
MSEPIFPLTAAVIEAAIAEKDKRISELCAELRKVYETTSADPRLFDAYQKIDEKDQKIGVLEWAIGCKDKQILEALDREQKKDEEIKRLNTVFRESCLASQEVVDGYKKTILMQQQRLAEATFIIERIGKVSVGNGDVIRAAQNWLKPLG